MPRITLELNEAEALVLFEHLTGGEGRHPVQDAAKVEVTRGS